MATTSSNTKGSSSSSNQAEGGAAVATNKKKKEAITVSESEIAAGAERLAEELRPFVSQSALPATTQGKSEDLQLSICRKLREVSSRKEREREKARDCTIR